MGLIHQSRAEDNHQHLKQKQYSGEGQTEQVDVRCIERIPQNVASFHKMWGLFKLKASTIIGGQRVLRDERAWDEIWHGVEALAYVGKAYTQCAIAPGKGEMAKFGLLDLSVLSCSNMQLSHFAIKANFLSLLLVALHVTPVSPPSLMPPVNKSPTNVSAQKPTNWQSHPFSSYSQSLTASHMYVLKVLRVKQQQ